MLFSVARVGDDNDRRGGDTVQQQARIGLPALPCSSRSAFAVALPQARLVSHSLALLRSALDW